MTCIDKIISTALLIIEVTMWIAILGIFGSLDIATIDLKDGLIYVAVFLSIAFAARCVRATMRKVK